MPRGFPPTSNVAVTLSVAVSITDTEAEPSLDTYANGAASALSSIVTDMTVAQITNRAKRMTTCSPSSYAARRIGAGADDRLCYTSLRQLIGTQIVAELSLRRACPIRPGTVVAAIAALLPQIAPAQEVRRTDPLVVTATRTEERAFDLPVAIDSVDAARIQQDQLQINLSESLARVPGLVIQNRWNYAQDLQISSRGFGARASFGARGIRLFQDGIPATMPDGQGQTGSFSLASAQRIEVLRGPFSTLYGNAAGGVIAIFTEDGPQTPFAQGQIIGGSFGTWNAIAKLGGEARGVNYVMAANHFETDGYRDHSEASRDQFNAKLKFALDSDTRVTLIANTLYQPEALDPLGLTRAEMQANPRQADPAATLFDTRKTVGQQQGGATIERSVGADTTLRVTGYAGHRTVRQYLALSGIGDTSSGGVTDLDGNFGGVDVRVTTRLTLGGGPLLLTVGAQYDRQDQARKGYVNNNGALGALRRDEDDTVRDQDVYAQAEWSPLAALSLLAGVRSSGGRFSSDDNYITATNPNDSGRLA